MYGEPFLAGFLDIRGGSRFSGYGKEFLFRSGLFLFFCLSAHRGLLIGGDVDGAFQEPAVFFPEEPAHLAAEAAFIAHAAAAGARIGFADGEDFIHLVGAVFPFHRQGAQRAVAKDQRDDIDVILVKGFQRGCTAFLAAGAG